MLKIIINNDIIFPVKAQGTKKNIKTINFVFADVDILCFQAMIYCTIGTFKIH